MNNEELTKRKAKLSAARQALLQRRLRGQSVSDETDLGIKPLALSGLQPLSYTQLRVWFLQQLYPDNQAYNMSEAWRIRGPLAVNALRQALGEVVRRHASLRTRFVAANNEPGQLVDETVDLPLPVTDISHLTSPQLEKVMLEMVRESGNYAFELSQSPLIRPSLIRLGREDHLLQLVLHHIVTDEWSNDIIWRELNHFYNLALESGADSLPPVAIQYGDYADWQRTQIASGKLDKQMNYWQKQLSGELPVLQLPTDRPRVAEASLRGGIVRRTLPAELLQGIKELGQRERSTLFATLLAAFQTLLHRYSSQDDILVGTPIANRQRPETENVVGMFINTVVVRAKISGAMTFRQHLSQVKQTVVEALANQDLPFDLLVHALQPDRDLSYNPLFQSMFVFRSDAAERTLPGTAFEPIRIDRGVSKFDLTLFAEEEGGHLISALEYSADLFDEPTAQRMLGHWQTLLEAIVVDSQTPIASLPLLPAAERKLVLETWNDTARSLLERRCVHLLISEHAARDPQAEAIVSAAERLTYGDLDARANQLAQHLITGGAGPGTRVGLYIERSTDMLVGILGILKAGAAYVPLEPSYPAERILFTIRDSKVPLIVTQSRLLANLPATEADFLIVDDLPPTRDGEPSSAPPSSVELDDLAYIIYTSGSTGRPKGVMVTHRNLLASTMAREAYYRKPVGRFLLLSSFAFDSSVAGIFWSLTSGGTLLLPSPDEEKDVQNLAIFAATERATHTLTLPSLYRLLLEYAPPGSLESLEVVIVAGESCPPDLGAQHYALLPKSELYNEYGPTEATVWCSVYRLPKTHRDGPVPIGRPIASSRLYVLDSQLQPVPLGVSGELFVGGQGVTPGYWHRPELTAERFPTLTFDDFPAIGRVYRTGDLARWRADGQLQFLGRSDDQIKIRGYRVEPGEIESVLKNHPSLKEVVVLALEEARSAPEDQAWTPSAEELLQALLQLDPDAANLMLSEVERYRA